MMENNHSRTSVCNGYNGYGMCGGKSCRLFCGIFLIFLGLFLLGKRANWFPDEFMILFWPVVFVLTGVCFIALAFIKKRANDQGKIFHERK